VGGVFLVQRSPEHVQKVSDGRAFIVLRQSPHSVLVLVLLRFFPATVVFLAINL